MFASTSTSPMSSSRCIYRAYKRNGFACEEPCVHDTPFCSSHRRCGQIDFFQKLDVFMGSISTGVSANSIYVCMSRYWQYRQNHKDLGLQDAFDTVEMMTYLCDHLQVSQLAFDLKICVRKQKMSATFDIVSMMWDIWHFSRNKKAVAALEHIQKIWRAKNKATLQGPWPKFTATNPVDPFTMEALNDLPMSSVFSFWQKSGAKWRIFAFSGPEFHDYCFTHHQYDNPLTREPIPFGVRDRLDTWYRRHIGVVARPTFNPRDPRLVRPYDSPNVAFTDFVSVMETRHHISIQPMWLLDLTHADIMRIFTEYHETVRSSYMNLEVDIPGNMTTTQFALAREMMALVRGETAPSVYVCTLAVAIANQCLPLSESLPDWVFDAADI